ncbi:kinase-like domain-containing protein [Obelidium mucronatum]|nr:kinase-like domain-containing protein [Obelidium mucronatum]
MDAFKTLLGAASAKAAPLASQFADKAADFGKQASAYAHDKALGGRRRSAAAVSPLASAAVLSQPSQPEGTFAPGTPLRINNTGVTVDRFLAEGGFAHVYLVTADSGQRAVLKRTLCPDETVLNMMKSEIEFMKVLTGHANIVSFYDSEIIRRGDGHEVFILMEYCSGGPLVEYMNTRIDVRLTEPEILEIFRDVLQAVYHLHYNTQQSPILHRDLKIENVLIGSDGKFKVCDFGSATTRTIRKGVALSTSEIRKLEDEVERVTTLQYRAPEFCDFYVRMGVSEKVDVWALGVLLYKLCYYETPFENVGKLAILNARYEIPNQPQFSFEVKQLISSILVVDPSQRPNVHQVYSAVCKLLGTPCELPAVTHTRLQFRRTRFIQTSTTTATSATITSNSKSISTIHTSRSINPTNATWSARERWKHNHFPKRLERQ